MSNKVISRRPDDIVRPTCSNFWCHTVFEIPYRDRAKARYCPEHDQSGYWDAQRPQTFFQVPNHENVGRAKIKGQWHHIISVSLTGRRILVKRGRAKAFGFSVADVEDWTGIG